MRGIHAPQAQRADPPALDQSLPAELLEGKLDRTRGAADPAHELARVQFLSRRARQERQQSGLGRRTFDIRHGDDCNTVVSLSNTDVLAGRGRPVMPRSLGCASA